MQKRFRYTLAAFILSFLMMASLCIYSVRQYTYLVSYSNAVDHTNEVMSRVSIMKDQLRDFDIREREYMLMKDSSFLVDYKIRISKLSNSINILKGLITDNEVQQQTLIMLKSALVLRIAHYKENIRYLNTNRDSIVSKYYYADTATKQECYAYLDKMLERERVLFDAKFHNKILYQAITSRTTKGLLISFLVITIILFFIILYELNQKRIYKNILDQHVFDLKNSHDELEQIAFAASHDLKEPLRKMKIFSDRLLRIQQKNEEIETSVAVIHDAANEVQDITDEIANLVNLIKYRNLEDYVSLNDIVAEVLNENNDRIEANKTNFSISTLPVIRGDVIQLKILFRQLIDNALKFAKDDKEGSVDISSDIITGAEIQAASSNMHEKKFYRIKISDNGIGFDNGYEHKIFKAFQRLHNDKSKYQGKGIGLTLCRRIMINHSGFITAMGHIGDGTTIQLYFPIQ